MRLVGLVVALVAALVGPAGPGAGVRGAAAGSAAPVAVRPVPGRLLRGFEAPEGPYGPGHRGVKLAAGEGDPARAALPGVVVYAGVVAGVGWVTLDHGAGLETTHGPLAPRLVRRGRRVPAGAVLGRLAPGAEALHWGARLHGRYIDPLALLGRWEVHLVPWP